MRARVRSFVTLVAFAGWIVGCSGGGGGGGAPSDSAVDAPDFFDSGSDARDETIATGGCAALDPAKNKLDATVKAYAGAVGDAQIAAKNLEAQWLAVCNELDAALGLDATSTTATAACKLLDTAVANALAKGDVVTLDLPFQCSVDGTVEASCQADCAASVACDITASCAPGSLVVGCNGGCSGECDSTDGATCSGTCVGECTASAAMSCAGVCDGTCDAPTWTGTCETGCTASFSGSCVGTCNGTCDGTATTGGAAGNCAGKCQGTCSANASGSCSASCTGKFSGGICSGSCTGGCDASSGISCSGACAGTCKSSGGACKGDCHGDCTAPTSPPRCEGALSCAVDPICLDACKSQGGVHATCVGTPSFVVGGDERIFAAYAKFASDIGAAFNQTIALKDPITRLSTIGTKIEAETGLSPAATVCFASVFAASASAQASIEISTQASQAILGK